MSNKRFSREFPSPFSSPAKKSRLSSTTETTVPKENKQPENVNNADYDLWGEDFGEDEIEEIDLIASQAYSQEIFAAPKAAANNPQPSTSRGFMKGSTSGSKFQLNLPTSNIRAVNKVDCINLCTQVIGSSNNVKEIIDSTQVFEDFERKMLESRCHNSTFRPLQDNIPQTQQVIISDGDQLDKYKAENKRLRDDFLTKEGETEFLRQQLQQCQIRAERDKKERGKLMDDQTLQFQADLNGMRKEKENLKTQLEYQTLQINQLSEKIKLLESGSVKFTQPQNMVTYSRDKFNAMLNSKASPNSSLNKRVRTKETSIQVKVALPRCSRELKSNNAQYPLSIIPQTVFEMPFMEKSVVDIKIVEKIGKRNLPILQEEETFRIFENPELTKPVVTKINDKNLNVEFFLADLAVLSKMSSEEINSVGTIPKINKLVATTRELLLNPTIVLQKISHELQNDDIRDMNELYASDFYDLPVLHSRCLCEANAWYEKERGVEARRSVGVLSYVVTTSRYLAEYITGKTKLKLDEDQSYQEYGNKMTTYNSWTKKERNFEFLELILEFVSVVGLIRRSHQFGGLINAILILLANTQSTVKFCDIGLSHVYSIFREIVMSRPLLLCFAPLAKLMMEFCGCSKFVQKLCKSPSTPGLSYWKGALNFTMDACVLEIFIDQLQRFKLDPITTISVSKALIPFAHMALLTKSIPWLTTTPPPCNCCLNLLQYIIFNLCESSKIKVNDLQAAYTSRDFAWRSAKQKATKQNAVSWGALHEDWSRLNDEKHEKFWGKLLDDRSGAIANGIRLLSYLAKYDDGFIVRNTEIEDGFYFFLHHIDRIENLQLHECDRNALEVVKRTFILEKTFRSSCDTVQSLIDEYSTSPNSTPSNSQAKTLAKLRRSLFDISL